MVPNNPTLQVSLISISGPLTATSFDEVDSRTGDSSLKGMLKILQGNHPCHPSSVHTLSLVTDRSALFSETVYSNFGQL